jgi:hypothetical protein
MALGTSVPLASDGAGYDDQNNNYRNGEDAGKKGVTPACRNAEHAVERSRIPYKFRKCKWRQVLVILMSGFKRPGAGARPPNVGAGHARPVLVAPTRERVAFDKIP